MYADYSRVHAVGHWPPDWYWDLLPQAELAHHTMCPVVLDEDVEDNRPAGQPVLPVAQAERG